MYLIVNEHKTFCYTAGKTIDPVKPTVVFVHGVLNDHSVWILQSRYLANHGWNVLAVDLPGHCKSDGEAPASVEDAADFIAALLAAAGVERAALIGHSWGSLIALETASRLKDRISHLVMVGAAFPMKVSSVLLETSLNEPLKALAMINVLSRSTLRTCSKSPKLMRSLGDEKELPERHQSRTIRSHQASVGKRTQKNQSQASRPVRGVLCGAVPAQERLPVAHAARRVSQMAHGAFVLCDLE